MRPLAILGVTGSIGRQTLEVARHLGWPVGAVAARSPSADLARILKDIPDVQVAVAEGSSAERDELARSVENEVIYGQAAIAELAGHPGRIVVNGIVGAAGLGATLAALEAGNRVALANKESMVAAGPLVKAAARRGGGELIPVDSEHSALHQCLAGEHPEDVARLILTASGGPFRGMKRVDLTSVRPEQALAHPTWDMGGRITIDSATLMNKGLEVIETHHLFGVGFDRIEVVVHPRSIVHSAVEFVDGALKAHIGHPDMRVPIQYALTYPRRGPNPGAGFSLAGTVLDFEPVDRETFPALDLAFETGRRGGAAPAALNAADEVAVAAFLGGELPFLAIVDVVAATVDRMASFPAGTLEEVLAVDEEARRVAAGQVASARSRR
jgi:1-deoxy-D-xylulose-5-phosphate reductoisomerase